MGTDGKLAAKTKLLLSAILPMLFSTAFITNCAGTPHGKVFVPVLETSDAGVGPVGCCGAGGNR